MSSRYSRRKFITDTTKSIGYFALTANSLTAFAGCVEHSEKKSEEQIRDQKAKEKLGIALVGLGGYSTGELAPALQETQHCYLAGIVTGTPSKADNWKKKYNIPDKNVYNYQTFDSIIDNPDIDIVYVVLPNALHAEYVIRAAKAGKHVICEKPMATSVEDCDRMIAACKEAGKMLSIGYRLHFEPHNQEMMRLGREKPFGKITALRAENGFIGPHGWRLNKKLAGGGPLMDMGIYCVQGVRYTTGMEPIAVKAQEGPKTDKETFKEVEQSINWQFEFPGNVIADCKTSYADNMSMLHADAENGWFELKPAFGYGGLDGSTSKGPMNLPNVNQQAKQMDDFAMAIKDKRPTPVPGEMGKQDVKLLMAIYKAAATGQRVEII